MFDVLYVFEVSQEWVSKRFRGSDPLAFGGSCDPVEGLCPMEYRDFGHGCILQGGNTQQIARKGHHSGILIHKWMKWKCCRKHMETPCLIAKKTRTGFPYFHLLTWHKTKKHRGLGFVWPHRSLMAACFLGTKGGGSDWVASWDGILNWKLRLKSEGKFGHEVTGSILKKSCTSWWVSPIVYRVSTFLLVVQDFFNPP